MQRQSWLERGAWCLGIVLVLLYGGIRSGIDLARAQTVAVLRASPSPELMRIDPTLWSEERVRAFRASSGAQPGAAGILRIPSLQLDVAVYPGTSELHLNLGAAHIEGTAPLTQPGNVGIAGHRDGFFRKLKDIRVDSEIYLEAGGRTTRFRVSELQIVDPSDVTVLAPTEVPSITLVTCYPFYFVGSAPQRYIVRAELDQV